MHRGAIYKEKMINMTPILISQRIALSLALLTIPSITVHGKIGKANAPVSNITARATDNIFYPTPAGTDTSRLIMPTNLEYRGAFKLPTTPSGTSTFTYVSGAMTFYPKGDPGGAKDGQPGSLFAAGHVSQQNVAEVDIPKPVISKTLAD